VLPPSNALSGAGGHAAVQSQIHTTVAQLWFLRGR